MANKHYDREFKEWLFKLREEDGLGSKEALDIIFEQSPKYKRKYGKHLSGRHGVERACAIVTGMRSQRNKRGQRDTTVWQLQLVSNSGVVITHERLTGAQVRNVMQALGIKGVA